jgi:hypothetical protein
MFRRTLILCSFTLLWTTLFLSLKTEREQRLSPPLIAPVQLPNQIPEPGEYVFHLLDSLPGNKSTVVLARR